MQQHGCASSACHEASAHHHTLFNAIQLCSNTETHRFRICFPSEQLATTMVAGTPCSSVWYLQKSLGAHTMRSQITLRYNHQHYTAKRGLFAGLDRLGYHYRTRSSSRHTSLFFHAASVVAVMIQLT